MKVYKTHHAFEWNYWMKMHTVELMCIPFFRSTH